MRGVSARPRQQGVEQLRACRAGTPAGPCPRAGAIERGTRRLAGRLERELGDGLARVRHFHVDVQVRADLRAGQAEVAQAHRSVAPLPRGPGRPAQERRQRAHLTDRFARGSGPDGVGCSDSASRAGSRRSMPASARSAWCAPRRVAVGLGRGDRRAPRRGGRPTSRRRRSTARGGRSRHPRATRATMKRCAMSRRARRSRRASTCGPRAGRGHPHRRTAGPTAAAAAFSSISDEEPAQVRGEVVERAARREASTKRKAPPQVGVRWQGELQAWPARRSP